MLAPDSPRRRDSQAPIKITFCHGGCGSQVEYRTNPRVCCAACKARRTLAIARASMDRQRRKRGIAKVKGVIIACSRCRCDVVLNRNRGTRFCSPCARENDRERARRSSSTKHGTPEGKQYERDWQRHKRATDPGFRVSAHMRVLMHRALEGKKAGRSWRSFVPYTLEALMAHLERQFLPGMSWGNKGEWHIDHVRPLSSFKFQGPEDAEFQAAWALSNLRPLWGIDNIRKQARRTHLL